MQILSSFTDGKKNRRVYTGSSFHQVKMKIMEPGIALNELYTRLIDEKFLHCLQ